MTADTSVETAAHPLDPLTADEVSATASVLQREGILAEGVHVVSMTPVEPHKQAALSHRSGDPLDRRVLTVLRDRTRAATVEVVVSLAGDRVDSRRDMPGAQTPFTLPEALEVIQAVRSHPEWQAAVRRRGVDDLELASIDPWPPGYHEPRDDPRRRLARAYTWVQPAEGANAYARPVEGLVVLVDLDRLEVIEVEDHGVVPLPPKRGDYWPEGFTHPDNVPHFTGVRDDLRPIEITQPHGPSFTVHGREVTWHKWRFRVGFTHREGLVLHMVAFQDRDRWRPVLHRASLGEMVVPYGDPAPTHWRKNAFDVGEAGFGWLANSLELGCDCLGEIHYFDAVVSDPQGQPHWLVNAICMHEEDFSLAWKHQDFQTGRTEVRRRRRLVISQVSTIANYEYGMYWYLYEDGTIELEMKSTGIVSTGAVPPGHEPRFGSLLAPGLYAPNHQHFFCFRLDMSVDGPDNSVYEVASAAAAPADNPHGNAWRVTETLLARESQAQRLVDPLSGRHWKVVNPGVTNRVGQPVGYRLMPGQNIRPFFTADSAVAARAGFATRHLWVTPYTAGENFPAGDYPYQHPGGDGLPRYTRGDRPLENTDLVLWYVAGAHHPVRPEDWPVMPVSSVGFTLQPVGFFDGNPAIDLARPAASCHHPA
jgi:primary-amine oxidase